MQTTRPPPAPLHSDLHMITNTPVAGAHHTTTTLSVLTQVRGLEVNSAHARNQVTSANDDGSEGDKDGGEVDGKVKWNDWF